MSESSNKVKQCARRVCEIWGSEPGDYNFSAMDDAIDALRDALSSIDRDSCPRCGADLLRYTEESLSVYRDGTCTGGDISYYCKCGWPDDPALTPEDRDADS